MEAREEAKVGHLHVLHGLCVFVIRVLVVLLFFAFLCVFNFFCLLFASFQIFSLCFFHFVFPTFASVTLFLHELFTSLSLILIDVE